MTTKPMKLDSALSGASEKNFLDYDVSLSVDGSGITEAVHRSKTAQSSSDQRPIVYELFPQKEPKKSFSKFSQLVKKLEDNQETAAPLTEARKWVADQFYSEQLTLASLRLKAGLSQRQLGTACGIEQSHVSRYESGKHEPSMTLAFTMAEVLGVKIEIFYQAWKNSKQANKVEG